MKGLLDDTHTKVTSYKEMVQKMKEKQKYKSKIDIVEIKLPFEVEQHPLKIDIDYQYLSEDLLDDGTRICHVLYLLKIDFIAKK